MPPSSHLAQVFLTFTFCVLTAKLVSVVVKTSNTLVQPPQYPKAPWVIRFRLVAERLRYRIN